MRRTDDLPKALKREIRELAGRAHELALGAELAKLEGEFAKWRAGELDAFALSAAIHRFHEGPARRLWIDFNTNNIVVLGALAARAMPHLEMSSEARAYLEGL